MDFETIETKESTIDKLIRHKSKIISLLVVVILVVGGSLYYYNFMTTQAKAKITVAKYIKAIQQGKSTYDYVESGVNDFINVLDYKFIRVIDKEKPLKTYTKDHDMYEIDVNYGNGKEKYKDFNDYLKQELEYYKEREKSDSEIKILRESTDSFEFTYGDTYDQIELLYDMEVTNGLGEKIYKKVYYTVDNNRSSKKFQIVDISY
ncbi:hypothetical protein [Paenibacillus aceti]|uniref:Uncharacterized protein n=1 Tax=Paenibacillus aceti TaxID=1820010 RepID=A0ABQ1VP82_9BACL|nr:hypothetical protein [Paenibacillus aceti]GGF86385.1 hypothetical protein GCM10010913_04810 [Paenibacillus aceti]